MTIASAPPSGLVRRLVAILRSPTVLLMAGVGLSALAGSGFLATVNHSGLSNDAIAPLPGLYFLLAAIGTGMFAGFEQEMTRAVSRALALGQSEHDAIRQQMRNATWVAVGTAVILGAGSPFVVHRWFYGNWLVFAELLIGLCGLWAAFLVRGVLSGRRQFQSYAVTMVVEGLARLVPAILLAAVGLIATWGFGLVYALGFVVAAVSGLLVARAPITDGPPPEGADRTVESANLAAARLARLTGGILAGQVLTYAAPLFITAKIGGDLSLSGSARAALVVMVGSAVGLTRLGLLVVLPLQMPMLPKLTAAAARGELHEVRRSAARLVAVVLVAGLAAALLIGAIGPWVVHVIFGTVDTPPRAFLVELSIGTLFMLVANVEQPALIALNRQQTVLVAWVLGVVVMAPLFLLPFSVLTTGAVAAMLGPLATVVIMTIDVLRITRAATPDAAAPAQTDVGVLR
jgi:O-antigen/teichoic acid export membrane protein